METTVKFAKLNDTVIIPSKESENAGFDIYANFEDDYIEILPHETKMIPTNLISACDEGYYFQLFGRGSTGTKGIAQMSGVIDSGYRGEWFVPLTNTTNTPIVIIKKDATKKYTFFNDVLIYPYEKAICQAVLLPVPKTTVEELSVDEIMNITSKRGTGCIGSSNK